MKHFFFIGIVCIMLYSCKKNVSQTNQPNNTITSTFKGFEIKGTLENFYPEKVYLNKIIEDSFYKIDSSEILNNNFQFKGIVEFPERLALTFENYSSITLFIIENTKFEIFINSETVNDPKILGSPLNSKLNEYKLAAKNIFKKIDYLFPQFQKARLENDYEKLSEIDKEMKKIEKEFVDFSYTYIIQNKESYIAPMLLRDQLKSTTIDTLQIKKTYDILSSSIKNSPDAEIVASFLNLH
ncbi:DUF4369 domain-containing protein [uncultured Lutibacter sp.]|uniref:DUF4369 domain-containing protein n=1 Tax=uncultured Lutibacter sp. TaxID=437739 RepID=UPI002616E8A2|nr:DUF4369 domain-containing protein [uncultured Lutibacter sp.]